MFCVRFTNLSSLSGKSYCDSSSRCVPYKTLVLPVTSLLTILSPPRGANVVFCGVEWFAKLGFSLGAQTGSDEPRFGEPNNMMS